MTTLRCFIQDSAATPNTAGHPMTQKVMVQNAGSLRLVDGEIDFAVGLASAAGLERPVEPMPRTIGSGETLQVGSAYRATDCSATFTRIVTPGG